LIEDIRATVKDAFVYGLGNLSVKLIGFVLLPLYLQRLTPADYGVLGLLEVTTQVLVQLFGLELYQALMRWYWDPDHRHQQRAMFFTVLVFLSGVVILLTLGLLPLTEKISGWLFRSKNYDFLVRLMLLSVALQVVTLIPSTLLRVQSKPGLYSVTHILNLSVSLGLTIFFIVSLGMKVEGIYLAQIAGYVFNLLILSGFIVRQIEWRFEGKLLKAMLKYSLPFVASSVAGMFLVLADRYILNYFGGLADVGVYSLGFKISNTIKVLIISSVQLAIYPIMFKMVDQPHARRFYSKVMTYLTFGTMIFILGVSLYGREIVKFFTGNRAYWEAFRIIPLLCFSILFGMLKDTATIGLAIVKKTQLIASLIVAMSLLNIGLNILLIPHYQALGAALAALLTQMLFFGAMLYFAQRHYPVPYEIAKIFKMIIVAGGMVGLSFGMGGWPLLLRIGSKLGLIILYPIALYFWRFYEPIEQLRLREIWKKWRHIRAWKTNLNQLFESKNEEGNHA